MLKIAFFGLGNMGAPMADNLARAGYDVAGFDLSAVARAGARDIGLRVVETPEEALQGVEAVVSMLPMGRHVLSAWADLAPRLAHGAILIDCSTIDVDSARAAHKIAGQANLMSLDAPVSGGVGGAKAATLTFMCGGTAAAFAAAKPILEKMGKRIVHCGEAGAGQAAKICNNMILGATMAATAEAFVLGEKLGLSHQALFDVASTSSGQSWSLTSYCPAPGPVPASPANNSYKPGFAAALMVKDLKLAQAAAAAAGAAIPVGGAASQLYALFEAAGYGGQDFSGIINFLRGRPPEE